MKAFKIVLTGIALLLTQACSHPIEIVGEGDVTSQSGNRNCSLEQFKALDPVCSKNYVFGFELNQLPAFVPEDYAETYNPVPRAGWHFDKWVNYCTTATAPNYDCSFSATAGQIQAFWGKTVPPLKAVFVTQCGDGAVAGIEQCDDENTTDGDGCTATCTIPPDTDLDGVPDETDNCPDIANTDQADFNSDAEGDACDDSDSDGTLDVSDGCPLNPTNPCALITSADIVTADGKEWAQPDLLTDLSWIQIYAACPDGACTDGAILNGRDMTGWTWADSSAVEAMFNTYGIVPPLGVGHRFQSTVDSAWAPAFFNAGWRPTIPYAGVAPELDIVAMSASYIAFYIPIPIVPVIYDQVSVERADYVNTEGTSTAYLEEGSAYVGVWLYRLVD